MRYVMPAHLFRAARLVSAAGAEFPFDILIPLRVTPCRVWQGMQELRDAYHVLAAERRPAPRPPPVVEALAPATERPSAGLNALALATQMEL